MTKNTTNAVEAIFLAALEKPLDQQQEFLQERCGSDAQLLQQVTELLAAHEQTGSFFVDKQPAWQLPTASKDDSAELPELVGQTIGPYTLKEQIGEGGMGIVYVAEQQRPIQRKVALKVIKPGMDSSAVLARFEAEQQALAMMNHRNIAKVLDAGIAESGRPYFVMELVSGIPITEYCDEKKLDIEQRLKLFIQVCTAIQHAHQKGIIHRDIKPSNVLVTEEDGQAIPKVIDFGVAKALSQKLTDRTLYTNFQAFLGTPLYASPEQASLSNVDVDTRSDVYSLGVLLYELVTGETPYNKEDLQKAAYEEMCRIIREQEAIRPSTRLSTMGDTAPEISKRRGSDPSQLVRAVRGDLDWIVMKALEKDRARRYEGANGLAADIGRLLKSEAIEARPPSFAYRMNRMITRHRGRAIAILSVGACMVLGIAFASFALLERYRVLRSHRILLIEAAFEAAINGNERQFNQLLPILIEAEVSADWLATLEGTMAFHLGDNESAIKMFGLALQQEPSNTAAWGLKTVALVDQGVTSQWNDHLDRANEFVIRSDFKDLDELCLAYATYHSDLDNAVLKLDDIVRRRPTWNMARAIFAAALAEKGEQEDLSPLIEKAMIESEVACHLTPDNDFVRVTYVLTRNIALRRKVGDPAKIIAETERIVRQLSQNKGYHLGLVLAADFRSLQEDHVQTEEAQREELHAWTGLPKLDGDFASRAIAELFRLGQVEDIITMQTLGDTEAEIAKAMFLSQDPKTSEQAQQILDSHMDSCDTWSIRSKIIELSLLLKDQRTALGLCVKWSDAEQPLGNDQYSLFYERLLEHFSRRQLIALETRNQWEAFEKQYFLALESFAGNRMESAKEHLTYCLKNRSMNVRDHWARAFWEKWGFSHCVDSSNEPAD